MKVSQTDIKAAGLTVLYDPDDPSDAVVDVVLVHGVGGHPVRTWKWIGKPEPPQTPKSARSGTGSFKRLVRRDTALRRSNSEPLLVLGTKQDSSGRSRNVLRKNSFKSTPQLRVDTSVGDLLRTKGPEVYWPLDLLPKSCPNARIWVWGYHTLNSHGQPLRLQNDLFAYARDLLLDLADARGNTGTASRPIIFIAHSTGGVLVKELLRLSEQEGDGPVKSILLSSSATIFLGCPHRSTEHARLGDAVRSMASMTLGVDSRDAILWDLSGSESLELELGRQAFTKMWDNYNFRVKTFQESMVSAAEFLEIRAEAAVRRQSSFVGDPRESAETIAANHLNMCKFSSADDIGYRSLSNSLEKYTRNEADRKHKLTRRELACLTALGQPQLPQSETRLARAHPGTSLWLYDLPEFQAWYHRTDSNKNKVLWIRAQSGSGKSTLLRALRSRIKKQWAPAGASIIWIEAGGKNPKDVFFPGSCGQYVETDPCRVYRGLLSQLFMRDPQLRKALVALYEKQRNTTAQPLDDATVVSFCVDDYIDSHVETNSRRTFIFIDVSDTCGPAYLRDVVSHLSQLARNSNFSICLASGNPLDDGHAEEDTMTVHIQHRNTDDILRYVNITLTAEWDDRDRTVVRITQKAAGVFLWAEIVVDILNAAIGEGASQEMIEYTLDEMPGDLHGLYEWMLNTLNDREKREALVLFQWVILAAEPLRLNDLLVAVRLTKTWEDAEGFHPYMALELDPPSSMRELRKIRNSEVTTDNPYQFNRWFRARSIGLLELRPSEEYEGRSDMINESLGLQRVQVTHDSVRTFFLSGRGFACLSPTSTSTSPPPTTSDLIDKAHYSLLNACLTYLNMRDFEPLASSSSSISSPSRPHHPSSSTPLSPTQHHTVQHQRALITSSYPFLGYAVRNLLFHLLCPHEFRYFLPQHNLLAVFAANRCRLWRRWTSLLGCSSGADPKAVVAMHDGTPAERLLSPVFAARFRLERVFRKLGSLVRLGGRGLAMKGDGVLSSGLSTLDFPAPPRGLSGRAIGVGGKGRVVGGRNASRNGSRAESEEVRAKDKGKTSASPVLSPPEDGGRTTTKSRQHVPLSPVSPQLDDDGCARMKARQEKGKMPLDSHWPRDEESATALSPEHDRPPPEWPLTPESSEYTSHYSSPVMSGYSSHYSREVISGYSSGGWSSRRSPLRPDTFQALDGVWAGR